jgi:putative FmdB family regulatory protein
MPTYAFRCPKCGSEIESVMKISEYSTNPKPKCCADGCDGQQDMVSVPFATPASFKGAGWTPNFSDGTARGPSTDLLQPKKFR